MFLPPAHTMNPICQVQRSLDNVHWGTIINRKHINAAHTEHNLHARNTRRHEIEMSDSSTSIWPSQILLWWLWNSNSRWLSVRLARKSLMNGYMRNNNQLQIWSILMYGGNKKLWTMVKTNSLWKIFDVCVKLMLILFENE